MGNCSFKGVFEDCPKHTRVLTDSGSVLEFKGPKLASEVLHSYPGYGIFKQGHSSSQVPYDELLLCGKFYYLLPLEKEQTTYSKELDREVSNFEFAEKLDSNEAERGTKKSSVTSEYVESLKNGSALEVLPSDEDGVWRVKLMIDTKKLEEIFSEQGNTEALIERMRMAASSATLTPRQSKSFRASGWLHNLYNLFKAPIDNRK